MIGCLAGLGAACGGDDDGGGVNPDAAPQADADPEPDAAPDPQLARTGTIAITETALTNPGLDSFSGALVRVGFTDETTRTVAPLEGFTSPIGGCLITVYDVAGGDEEPAPADEGAVAVTGTASGPFACGFVDAETGYVCQSTDAAVAGGVAGNAEGATVTGGVGTATFAITGTTFPDSVVGMHVRLSGFPNTAGNDEPVDGVYPIVNANTVDTTTTLTLAGTAFAGVSTGDADSTFTTFVGVGPVPGGFSFLDDGTADVAVTKAAGDVVDAIDATLKAAGEGFTLRTEEGYFLPHTFPFTAQEVKFGCDVAGGGCGAAGDGLIDSVITVNGVTTDADVTGLPPNAMPDATGSYATFTCSDISGTGEITLSQEAVAAILGTSPTRIQVSVGHLAGNPLAADDGTWTTNVVVGHNLLGYSTAAAE